MQKRNLEVCLTPAVFGHFENPDEIVVVLDFADFGNSPFNFTEERVKGETIVYSTTNCTRIIEMAKTARSVVIGSFLNITSLSEWLISQPNDVILLCAAWKNKVNIEDTICAGAFAERLLQDDSFETICDSAHIATDTWNLAKGDPMAYVEKAAQRSRLRDKGLDDCIEFCLRKDVTLSIPMYIDGKLRNIAGAGNTHD